MSDKASPQIRVGVRELRNNLTRYLGEVKQGASILVTSREVVIAEMRAPAHSPARKRQPGALRGQIWMADDFDQWPSDLLDAFEA